MNSGYYCANCGSSRTNAFYSSHRLTCINCQDCGYSEYRDTQDFDDQDDDKGHQILEAIC